MPPALRFAPSIDHKLERLGRAAAFDLSCACGDAPSRERGLDGLWIYPAALPSGQRVPMLKVLQQGGCERGCHYCAQRLGGIDQDPLSFSPDDLARAFVELHRRQRVFGLFLSSAIHGGAVYSMDRILATAELLRSRHGFRGYLHLKVIPGAEPAQIERAMALATRVSVNMELPTAAQLARVAPAKAMQSQILAPMRQIARAEAEGRFSRGGQTTQLVVGATDETDHQIARAADWLYRRLRLRRVYYSGFQPVAGTPLQGRAPAPFIREHRLYQLDFLLRSYGFELDEIPFSDDGALEPDVDPKSAWARRHPERFPVEVNSAALEELVRVPGIGPRSARNLVRMRRESRIRGVAALRAACTTWRMAAEYVLLDGRAPARQLSLPL